VKKALITGVSGQDGSYLAEYLLNRGYLVYGTSRDSESNSFWRLHALGIAQRVVKHSMDLMDMRSILQVLGDVETNEIYHLAGQSSVGLSFSQPASTLESTIVGTLNILESVRLVNKSIRIYNASSSECFGQNDLTPADENTRFQPRSPYAVAKAAAHWQVASYRDAYGLFACSGILFNHESPLRLERFVTQKIVTSAFRIASGKEQVLRLGNLKIFRDWGWAPEYVEAMWRMLQSAEPEDYVIATGECHSLEEFTREAFSAVSLDWLDYVKIDETLYRPVDLVYSVGNPSKAWEKLGWRAKYKMADVVRMMVKSKIGKNPCGQGN
jgi:GDPmannose 4,6-dehydratase